MKVKNCNRKKQDVKPVGLPRLVRLVWKPRVSKKRRELVSAEIRRHYTTDHASPEYLRIIVFGRDVKYVWLFMLLGDFKQIQDEPVTESNCPTCGCDKDFQPYVGCKICKPNDQAEVTAPVGRASTTEKGK